MDLKNNFKNADFFKRHVHGARFNRGNNIPNRNIINLNVEKDPSIKIIAQIQGSGNSRYVINIFQENSVFKIIHDCPDFKKGTKFCKHIVKILLLLEPQICQEICQSISRMVFTSDFSLVKKSKTKSYILKADDLIQQAKYYEAISFLHQAFDESRVFDYIIKIGEIALKYNLYDQFLMYSVNFKDLANHYLNEYPEVISSSISNLKNYNFSSKVKIIINSQELLLNFPKLLTSEILKQIKSSDIDEPILKYVLFHKFESEINIKNLFNDFIKESKSNLNNIFDKLALDLVNEAILNMESEEEINSYISIAQNCKFKSYNTISTKIQEYRRKLRDFYREGLKLKHAFLRSLVIDSTGNDKLKQMKFIFKYQYPSLIWTSAYRNETPLHYYILNKCGFESHHLEYTNIDNFTENYPVFKEIFSGNNPERYRIKDFWGTNEPKIINTTHYDHTVELDFDLNFQDIDKLVLIEWDLAQKPILGSYICQFSDGFLIPDKTHPLTHEIQPFDIILCNKDPIAIKSNNIKTMKPLRRINIKTAIELVWAGIEYISSYLPLNLIDELKRYKIDELDAIDKIFDTFNNSFLPNKDSSRKLFHEFIQNKIIKELNKIYLKISNKPENKQKVLRMIGYDRYSEIFTKRTALQQFKLGDLKRNSLQELKLDLKKFISEKLAELIKNKNFEDLNIKVLRKFPKFKKWTAKLIYELKEHLEECKIFQTGKKSYDIHSLLKNYYGKIIVENALKIDIVSNNQKSLISDKELSKIIDNFNFLKLNPPKIINKIT